MAVKINRFALVTMLAMINVLCVGLTLTLTQWLARIPVVTKPDVQMFLCLLVLAGILCMALILAGKSKHLIICRNCVYLLD